MSESQSTITKFVCAGVNPKNGGILGKDGVWYTLSKYNEKLSPNLFSMGKEYEVETRKGKGGGIFIQKLISETKQEVVSPAPLNEAAKPGVSVVSKKDERNGKDIGNRGYIQAAAVAASNLVLEPKGFEETVRMVLTVMDRILEERNK